MKDGTEDKKLPGEEAEFLPGIDSEPEEEEQKQLWGRQKLFVEFHLEYHCKDPIKAYRKAGYKASGKYVDEQAYNLLNKPHIQAEIKRRLHQLEKRANVSLMDLLNKLGAIVNFDFRTLYDADGNLKEIQDLTQEQVAAIVSMEVQRVAGEYLVAEDVALPDTELKRGGGNEPSPTTPSKKKQKVKSPFIQTTTKIKTWDVKEAYDLLVKILAGNTPIKVNLDGSLEHKGKIEHEVTGGVLIVPGMAKSPEEWAKLGQKIIDYRQEQRKIVEGEFLEYRKNKQGEPTKK